MLTAANTLNERIVEEGIVLLENKNNALPLNEGANVTVFGRNSIDVVLGGSGSNQGDTDGAVTDVTTALRNAGFNCNTVIRDYYAGLSGYKRPDISMGTILTGYPVCEASLPYPDSVTNSYRTYSDAAIVVVSRMGGEGFDLPRTMFWNGSSYGKWDNTSNRQLIPGARSIDDHYLQLDGNERKMFIEACKNFDKVIVVVNSASPMELGFLDDAAYWAGDDNPDGIACNEKISAALWLGHPGSSGLNALGKVLNGKVNPSGRTVDTFPRDFRNDPSWQNFGNYLTNEGNRYYTGSKARGAYFVEYREGIYVGYRYYETMAAEQGDNGNAWYKENVIYPFGHGESYSTFEWDVKTPADLELTADGKVEITVNVQNVTNNRPGKDVVQLYYSAPYTPGGIEKAEVVLADFVKTETLDNDGKGQDVKLSFDVRDMASYDYADKNGNGFKGYELEAGEYEISVRRNAHDVVASFTFTLDKDVRYETDSVNKQTTVGNLFDDVSDHIDEYLSRENAFANISALSGASEMSYRNVSNEFLAPFTYKYGDSESDPWYSATEPTQSKSTLSYKKAEIKLYDLIGVDYEDALWDKLLDQLTVGQLETLVSTGNYRTLQIENIGKPLTIDSDGPMGFASF
ncbi:MAG: glycoside hydrolase family 3 C-terminal domain-containing protein, partial [Roseburia sp.]|nr:glycoside hydrolase family 3 C-terminal domain-containing protein [Roseburia sp.]